MDRSPELLFLVRRSFARVSLLFGGGGEAVDEGEVIRELERRFLPALRAAQAEINADFPAVRAKVWSQPHGQATDSPGHVIALSCFFPEAATDQPDELTLEVCVAGVRGPTCLISADVIWGYPGRVEMELFDSSVAMSTDALQRIEAELPRLVEVLRTAVANGPPRN